jgi:hypothetical protein
MYTDPYHATPRNKVPLQMQTNGIAVGRLSLSSRTDPEGLKDFPFLDLISSGYWRSRDRTLASHLVLHATVRPLETG